MPASTRLPSRSSWAPPLLAALLAFGLLAVTGVVAHGSASAQGSDADGLRGFHSLDYGPFSRPAEALADLGGPAAYGVGGLVLVLVALVRRRPRTAGTVAVLLVATAASTQLLKPLAGTTRIGPDGRQLFVEAWPSGHATAAMTLALCAVLVAPAVARPLAAVLGAAFAVVVALAILVLARHLPSDIVGGFLMAAGWALVGAAALAAAEARWPSGDRGRSASGSRTARLVRAAPPVLVAGALAAGLVALPFVARTNFATRYTTALLGAIAIAALAAVLALALARVMRPAARA